MEYLEVRLDDVRFALPAGAVAEVLRAAALTRVGRNACWDGVLNLRGEPVPILDLRSVLGLPSRPLCPSQYFVILEWAQQRFGIRVDAVDALAGLTPTDDRVAELRVACPVAERYLVGGESVIPLLSVRALHDALYRSATPEPPAAVTGRDETVDARRGGRADASEGEQGR